MRKVRIINVADLVHLLHLSVGGPLLFVRDGGLSRYKRERFREIGPDAPVEVAVQCSQYAHTLRGALLCIGDSGGVALQNRIYITASMRRTPSWKQNFEAAAK